MRSRAVQLTYAIPPVLAFVLACIGLAQTDESGVVGTTTSLTVTVDGAARSNAVVAAAIRSVAREHRATVVRSIADRTDPVGRRTLLVTDAAGTPGARWLADGYPSFSRSVRTGVRPISDLDRVDPTGTYDLIGGEAARRALVRALASTGYAAASEPVPFLRQVGIDTSVDGTLGLVGVLVLGSAATCLVATVGSPRGCAVRRLHGQSTLHVLLQELRALRTTAIVVAVGVPLAATGLVVTNGGAQWPELLTATTLLCGGLLTPVVVAHVTGVAFACRRPLADAVRGSRPPAGLLALTVAARTATTLLLVSAVVGLVGSVVVARSTGTERDLRAAGSTVQLWVTPDPRPVDTQAYWDRLGAFAGRSLADHDALLAALAETSTGTGRSTVPALFVDAEYLRLRDVRAADGSPIRAERTPTVWLPAGSTLDPTAVARSLGRWELRGGADSATTTPRVGRLRQQSLWTFPGDGSSRGWVSDAVLVVVPDPAATFSADQLGAWLSSGDVVFRTRRAAERAIRAAGIGSEISAVVDVGQAAAETTRAAARAIAVGSAAVASGVVVTVALTALTVGAHRRRHGRLRFARAAAGVHPLRADGALFAVEAVVLVVAATWTIVTSSRLRPDGTGPVSAIDPLAQAGPTSAVVAFGLTVLMSAVGTVLIAASARSTMRRRGDGAG